VRRSGLHREGGGAARRLRGRPLDGTQFLLVPGHEDERVERVVEERPRYSIVRKVHQAVAAYVRRLDPRAETA